jgi:stearoyl-CoA desaturase (Delta-9 desaturase)
MTGHDTPEETRGEGPAACETRGRPSLKLRLINLAAVVVPLVGVVLAVGLLVGFGFSWVYPALLVGMYLASGLGVTVGYHRLFTHRSFETSRPVAFLLAVLGSMAVQGPVLKWVAVHRRHHQHSDHDGDPHSPHTHGDSLLGTIRGMIHAHVGWLFTSDPPGLSNYVRDLHRDPWLRKASRLFPLWVLIGLALPAILGGLMTMSWAGVLMGFLWGGLMRVFLLHHMTWSVNSICHIWGSRPFRSQDESRNNVIVGVLGLGEGWHNNHHAFPTSARHGLSWWQLDASYLVIRAMALVGLARKVRLPIPERVEAKRARPRRSGNAGIASVRTHL